MEKVLSKDFTDEDMLIVLKNFYEEHGRRPYMKDFKGRAPSCDMISKRFGSWSKAIELAGIPKGKLREGDFSKDELIEQLHDFVKKYGKAPTHRKMREKGYAGIHAFINHFGSFKNALIEANVFDLRKDQHQFCETYNDEELLDYLKKYMNNKNRIPTSDTLKEELSPSASTYDRRFGSVFNALSLIGYDYEKQKENDLIELQNDMIIKYKKLQTKLRRTPSSRDIEHYSRTDKSIYSMSSYEFHFGSLYELQVLCGFTPTVIGRNKSREDLISDLVRMSDELERTPSQNDVKYFNDVASPATYTSVFSSWNSAIKEAGLKPNGKIYYSTNGLECLSYYELLFTNMLEKYDIKFEKEKHYKEYIETNRRFRFDYVLDINNIQYFIEIFGITSREDYEERTEHKIKLCRENNLPLIEIYPKDFKSYKLEDIQTMFEEKMQLLYK